MTHNEPNIAQIHQHLFNLLSPIHERFGAATARDLWNINFLPLVHIKKAKAMVRRYEDMTKPVDWDNLPAWIEQVVSAVRFDSMQLAEGLKALRIDTKPSSSDSKTLISLIESSPFARQLRRALGPNWATWVKNNSFNVDMPISHLPKFRDQALKLATQVIMDWESLLTSKTTGKLDILRQRWDRLTEGQRKHWLKREFAYLFDLPHPEIYGWIRSTNPERSTLPKGFFMMALLNLEDLCKTLPDFLETRAAWHPGFFRTIDSRSLPLGYYAGGLKLRVPGAMKFFSDTAVSYIQFEDKYDHAQAQLVRTDLGLYQLGAQQRIYAFLSSCPQKFVDLAALECPSQDSIHQSSSLFNQASLLDFRGHPNRVDLDYLVHLTTALRDEAMDHLRQLRSDPDSFIEYWNETSGQGSERVSNLLHTLFYRIDTFQSLSHHLDDVKKRIPTENETAENSNTARAYPSNLMSLYTAFQSCLTETVQELARSSWSPDSNSVFSQLFNMAKELNPVIWMMGIPSVMRVIDREIRADDFGMRIPVTVMQALNDIAILAVCTRETWKHYTFVVDVHAHIDNVNDLEIWWAKRSRPWTMLAERASLAMGNDDRSKLEKHTRRKDIDKYDRMCQFWDSVDNSLRAETVEEEEIVELIMHSLPRHTLPLKS
ncbi:hypothetical protein BU24DRAFT_454989 [Aaosphaeria arxii CBS 175.79]|uniref:Uncharacterized protein n=1 Tax=Aaosphaeria arxii CBS 175.79 TaxID=1450172 RepID=A0A6A5XCP1_9PLEO|nr:uncharacterized protein BU24DRAFT_454989 [Aaosphaeria arxii CBS 175.79]KAF2010690.1 hypothetical protein BU24DRAFT_454989 [Aaosphaeria arxii CBS 175.79]